MFRNFNTSVSPKILSLKYYTSRYLPVYTFISQKAVRLHIFITWQLFYFSNLLYFIFLKASLSHVEAATLLHPVLLQWSDEYFQDCSQCDNVFWLSQNLSYSRIPVSDTGLLHKPTDYHNLSDASYSRGRYCDKPHRILPVLHIIWHRIP